MVSENRFSTHESAREVSVKLRNMYNWLINTATDDDNTGDGGVVGVVDMKVAEVDDSTSIEALDSGSDGDDDEFVDVLVLFRFSRITLRCVSKAPSKLK